MKRVRLFRKVKTYSLLTKVGVRPHRLLHNRALSIFVLSVMVFALAGQAGVFSYVSNYFAAKDRMPRPLNSQQVLPDGLAADAASHGEQRMKLPQQVLNQLSADKLRQETGEPQNHTHIKVLDAERTETATTYLNADGSKTQVVSTQATSYKDLSGKWQTVDVSLAKGIDGKWRTKANAWQATFGSSAEGLQLGKNGQTFSMVPASGNNVQPTITGKAPDQVLTYKNVWDGVDIQYKVAGSQIKESIVIHKATAPSSFTFAYSGATLSAKNGEGAYTLDGELAGFQLAAPTVTTKKGFVTDSQIVTQTANGGQVQISLKQGWLQSQPASAFPIVIDPTVFVGTNYTNVISNNDFCDPGEGCGNSVGHDAVNNVDWRFLYHVPVPAGGANQVVANAVLHLEMTNPAIGFTGSEQLKVNRASCLNAFACYDQEYGEASGTATTSADIEMAGLYRAAVAATDNDPWFMVRGEEGGSTDKYKLFDDTKTKITFTYETLPGQSLIDTNNPAISVPANGGITVTTQPTLASLPSSDPDGPGPQRFRYIVGTSKVTPQNNSLNLKPSISGIVSDSGTLDSPQWVVPDNVLQDGNTYYWQALVWDGYNTSPTPWVHSPVYSFKVDLRNGKDATQAFDTFGPISVDFATGNVTADATTHTMTALGGSVGLGMDYNSPLRSRPGLVGEYWNDPLGTRTFPGASVAPTLTRVDPNVNFNWGAGSPYTGVVSTDNFLTRWSGWFVAPSNGTYQFGTTSDDRSRIFVNDSLYVDGWSANPTNSYGTGMALTAGQLVKIRYEFAEWGGNASAQLLVKTTDGTTVTPRVIPTTWLQTGPRSIAATHGLVGRYYTDPGAAHTFPADPDDNSRLFLVRTDTSINQNWGANAPVPGGPNENFMVRWTGQFRAPLADTYKFGVGSDDGARVYINGNLVTNAWSDHGASPITYGSNVPLGQGDIVNITVEYYENTGAAQMGLYVQEALLGSTDIPVDSNWLIPQVQALPDGWGLGLDVDGALSYSFASINSGGVTLYDSNGQTHEYKYANGGFTPPTGETGQMVRNSDGTVTVQDEDGQTYVFARDGTITTVTRPTDDRKPAALQYVYGSIGGSIPRLTQVSDPVTQSDPNNPLTATRWLKVYYGGDTTNCPAAPANFIAVTGHSFICAVKTSDGRVTGFFYTNGSDGIKLGRITTPGNESTDYQYISGLLSAVRSSLANDAITAGLRAQDNTELTTIGYDGLGRANAVTLPAATAGATRLGHTYDYLLGNATQMHVVNATEPSGFSRKVTYDNTYRTLTDTDVANLTTTTVWDPLKDLIKSVTDPAGLRTTTLYDYADRPIDQYGPAPAAWFDANGVPLTTPTNFTPQVPHTQTAYEEGINGLAAAYYNLGLAANSNNAKVLFGSPKLHGTGVGPVSGDVLRTWGGAQPYTPVGTQGWGISLTGWIHMATNGNYTFRTRSDDGARLWVNDILLTDDWVDGGLRNHPHHTNVNGVFNNNGGDKWYRIRLDYYNKLTDNDAQLELYMTPPGGSETSALGSLLKPNYGLVTTAKEFDGSASVGDRITTTSYGANPELGLAQSTTTDPAGLNLTTTNTYETQGAAGSFLRQTSKTLPGGATTSYTYYGGTETRDNPCTPATESFVQAGLLKMRTEPDPDGAGSQVPVTTETIYDDSGRVVATRFNAETSWTCLTYDSRSRITQKVVPTNANGNGRTITYDYAVGGNPFKTSTTEGSSTMATTIDLLGRATVYQDRNNTSVTPATTTYDTIGRMVSRNSSKMGLEEFTYDNFNRLTGQKLNSITLATPTYDAFGRLQQVTYPRANLQNQVIGRDSLGRINSLDYTLGNGTTHHMDTVTYSQSGQVLSGTELTKAKAYTYDKAGRLTNATLGTNTYAYSFAAPSAATCNQASANLNAQKSGNRTSQTVNGVTTTYCYDNADRLIASSDTGLTTPAYDTHGNTSSIGQSITNNYLNLGYDSTDRPRSIHQVFFQNYITQYEYDAEDRLSARFESQGTTTLWKSWFGYTSTDTVPDYEMDNTWAVRERYVQLPGGVLFTIRSSASSFSSTSNVYSFPNIHGDTMVTTNGGGSLTNAFAYEPFGKLSSTAQPDNANGKADFDYVGQFEKQTETLFGNQPQIMGARVYFSNMGRFVQPDPIDGGCSNPYSYVYGDPVNLTDITGTKTDCSKLAKAINTVRNELAKRYNDIRMDKFKLPWFGRMSVKGHQDQFREKQTNLRKKLNEWNDNGCNKPGGPSYRDDAWKWATRETPNPIGWRTVGKYALVGGAVIGAGVVVGVGVVIAPEVTIPALGAGGGAALRFAH